MTNFAIRINEILDKKGLKRASIIKDLEIPEATVRSWFNRDSMPAADVCYKVAKYLGVTMEYLLTGESEETKALDPLIAKIQKLTPEQKEDVEDLVDVKLARSSKEERKEALVG